MEIHQNPDPFRDRVSRLPQAQIDNLMYFVARDPYGHQVARRQLTNDLFRPGEEEHYLLFWSALVRAAERCGGTLPPSPQAAYPLVKAEVESLAQEPGSGGLYIPPVVGRVIHDLLPSAFYRYELSAEGSTAGFQLLAAFMTERKLSDQIRAAAGLLAEGEAFRKPLDVLRRLESEYTRVAASGQTGGEAGILADPTYRPPLPKLFDTGMPWLDRIMNGGQANGEAYVLLAPQSGGKTAFAVGLAVNGVKLQHLVVSQGGKPGFWHYFSWEASKAELQQRIQCYGAHIHADTYRKREPFSTAPHLKPYEAEKEVNNPLLPAQGELERLKEFAAGFGGPQCRLVIHDYSGGRSGLGLGGLPEAIEALRGEVHQGRPPAGVIIDYAGICIDRYVAANPHRYKTTESFNLLNSFMDDVRSKMAIPFDCPVWVLHQYHGDYTGLAAGVRMHHKHAKGSRNIADNADFAFNFGSRNPKDNLLSCWISKFRRAPGQAEPVILHFDGRFNIFAERDRYGVDPYSHSIVPRLNQQEIDTAPIGGTYTPPPSGGAGANL